MYAAFEENVNQILFGSKKDALMSYPRVLAMIEVDSHNLVQHKKANGVQMVSKKYKQLLKSRHSQSKPIELNFNRFQSNSIDINRTQSMD